MQRQASRPLPDAFRRCAGRPAVVGHRGVRGGPFIENTLSAMVEAKRQGADAIEIDVRACRSGEIVVLHDPDLLRLANDPRAVAAIDWSELRRIDLGGDRVPLLGDVVDVAIDLGLGLNVEIKHDVPVRRNVVGPVANELKQRARELDPVVSSFDPTTLGMLRVALPKCCTALLIHESTYHDWALRIARVLAVSGVHIEQSLAVGARLRPLFGRRFVNVWTINDPLEARRVFDLGAEAVITDVPAALRAAFEPAPRSD